MKQLVSPMLSSSPFRVVSALMLSLGLVATGCSSFSGSGSGSFASVTIQNHTMEEIGTATAQVFGKDGYRGGMGGGSMVFEKEASRATSFSREGIVNASYGAQTINRVRVEIIPLSDGSFRLQCKAFMVTGGSDPFFQDEVPVMNFRSGPFQKLLNKVAKQLK
jgi:hypothetical protein